MNVLDDEGRLFGLVNIVDALVAVFAVALVIGGLGLVLPSETAGAQQATVTIEADVHALGVGLHFLDEQVKHFLDGATRPDAVAPDDWGCRPGEFHSSLPDRSNDIDGRIEGSDS